MNYILTTVYILYKSITFMILPHMNILAPFLISEKKKDLSTLKSKKKII